MTQPSDKRASKASAIDRRRSDRMHFPATANLIDENLDSKSQVRVADLGKEGCYIDLLNPSPVGTAVTILIRHANRSFEARGTVTYALPRMGMGITFTKILPEHEVVLEEWLGIRPADPVATSAPAEFARPESARPDSVSRDILMRLITLLMRQRAITESQAADLLRDLAYKD